MLTVEVGSAQTSIKVEVQALQDSYRLQKLILSLWGGHYGNTQYYAYIAQTKH